MKQNLLRKCCSGRWLQAGIAKVCGGHQTMELMIGSCYLFIGFLVRLLRIQTLLLILLLKLAGPLFKPSHILFEALALLWIFDVCFREIAEPRTFNSDIWVLIVILGLIDWILKVRITDPVTTILGPLKSVVVFLAHPSVAFDIAILILWSSRSMTEIVKYFPIGRRPGLRVAAIAGKMPGVMIAILIL